MERRKLRRTVRRARDAGSDTVGAAGGDGYGYGYGYGNGALYDVIVE
jgi:hypothetical protein